MRHVTVTKVSDLFWLHDLQAGAKLLAADVRISLRLVFRLAKGKPLSRCAAALHHPAHAVRVSPCYTSESRCSRCSAAWLCCYTQAGAAAADAHERGHLPAGAADGVPGGPLHGAAAACGPEGGLHAIMPAIVCTEQQQNKSHGGVTMSQLLLLLQTATPFRTPTTDGVPRSCSPTCCRPHSRTS